MSSRFLVHREKHSRIDLPATPALDAPSPVTTSGTPAPGYGHELGKITILPKLEVNSPDDAQEREADRTASRIVSRLGAIGVQRDGSDGGDAGDSGADGPSLPATAAGGFNVDPTTEHAIESARGGGAQLPGGVRGAMEGAFGADFSTVRIHADGASDTLNRSVGARAFTTGSDIFFRNGEYSPDTTPGQQLLAHELTHVVQQGGAHTGVYPKRIQRAIGPTHDLTNGTFDVIATPRDSTQPNGPNVPITIKFTPKTTAPISNQIGLIQIVKLTNAAGTNVEPQSLPAARGASLRTQTTDATGVDAGYFTDVLHNPTATTSLPAGGANQGDAQPPQYPFGNGPAQPSPATPGLSRPNSGGGGGAIVGFKRSAEAADIKAAELTDAPGGNGEFDFAFETVAKGEDTQTIYGAMKWSFQIRSGKIQGDTSSAVDGQSATFDAALQRHEDFYVHEPVIFYFDFDQDTLNAAEIAKIATFQPYMARFATTTPTNPKIAKVSPQGFADQRGNAAHNVALSKRRAEAVKAALLAGGIPEAQIEPVTVASGAGATSAFTTDATTDQDSDANRQFNRRVVCTFKQVAP